MGHTKKLIMELGMCRSVVVFSTLVLKDAYCEYSLDTLKDALMAIREQQTLCRGVHNYEIYILILGVKK